MKVHSFLLAASVLTAGHARALSIAEFESTTGIYRGYYRLRRTASARCVDGALNLHVDSDDGSLTVTLGHQTLMTGLGATIEHKADGEECEIIASTGGVLTHSAWNDVRETCEGEETHVVKRLVKTARGFAYDVRSADAHHRCELVHEP